MDDRDLAIARQEVGCGQVLDEQLILQLARECNDSELAERYHKFKELQADPNMRECPKCKVRQAGSAGRPRMTCNGCGFVYCFVHADAHPGQSCREFERRERDAVRLNERFLARNTLPCPWCGKPTGKNGGCNHMTCSRCHKHWCWVCKSRCTNYEWHFEDANVWGCPGNTSFCLSACLSTSVCACVLDEASQTCTTTCGEL